MSAFLPGNRQILLQSTRYVWEWLSKVWELWIPLTPHWWILFSQIWWGKWSCRLFSGYILLVNYEIVGHSLRLTDIHNWEMYRWNRRSSTVLHWREWNDPPPIWEIGYLQKAITHELRTHPALDRRRHLQGIPKLRVRLGDRDLQLPPPRRKGSGFNGANSMSGSTRPPMIQIPWRLR